jgi:CBS domain-containing protein
MDLRDVMTDWVVGASPESSVREVAELMRQRVVGCVVLTTPGGAPVGLVTDRDLALGVLADGGSAEDPVIWHASSPVICAHPDTEVSEASDLMVRHGIRRLPLLEDELLVGIVSLSDLTSRCDTDEAARAIAAHAARVALPAQYFRD